MSPNDLSETLPTAGRGREAPTVRAADAIAALLGEAPGMARARRTGRGEPGRILIETAGGGVPRSRGVAEAGLDSLRTLVR